MSELRTSARAALLCKEEAFHRFLKVANEADAIRQLRACCMVQSRREFDCDADAAERFETVARAYRGFLDDPANAPPAPPPEKAKHCRYCDQPAQLLNVGQPGYPYRASYGPVWVCVPCGAWVGCHPGTTNALGGLANAELRGWKVQAHAAFDPLWEGKMRRDGCSKGKARRAGYTWLAKQLGLPVEKTHIGYMDVDECQKVVAVCHAVFNQV